MTTETILAESFENHEDWTHQCRVFFADGSHEDCERGNIFTPGGWTFWWLDNDQYDQPEAHHCHYDPVTKTGDKERIRTGTTAYQYFTFYRRHRAGLFRQLYVGAGKRVRVTAYAHGWANSKDGPHADDGDWSEWPGYEEMSINWNAVPELNGELANDAAGAMRFRVGVGTDDLAGVQWGDGVCIYNDYQGPVTVEVISLTGYLTVWLESQCLWKFKHNDAYWDDVTVEVLDDGIEPEPGPEPGPERGKPRIQYERTYVLLPPDANISEFHEAVDLYGGHTIGMSADDAGVGDLDVRNVIAIRPDAWPGDLKAFFEQYYPGVRYSVGTLEDTPNPSNPTGFALSQRDARWANTRFGSNGCTLTIGSAGCFITCLAMAQRWFDILDTATPVTVDAALNATGHGYGLDPTNGMYCLARWDAISERLGFSISNIATTNAQNAIDSGHLLLAEVSPKSLQHFVLVTDWDQGGPWCVNPWTGDQGYLTDMYAGADSYRLLTKTGQVPVPEPEPGVSFNPRVLTLHLQQNLGLGYAKACRPAGMKWVYNAQAMPEYAAADPGLICVYRGMAENDDPVRYVDNHIATVEQVIGMMQAQGVQKVNGKYFWIEAWNERGWNPDRDSCAKEQADEIALVEEWARRCPDVGVVALCAGVGNPDPKDFDLLVPLGQVVQANGGMFGLHSYFGATPTRCTLDNYDVEGRWLEYRFEMMDAYLVQHGVTVNWFLSEGGAIYYEPPTNMPSSGAGWHYRGTLDGNWPRYLAYLEQLTQHLHAWNSAHAGRLKGYALFTVGGGDEWKNFELDEAQRADIAAMQVRLWPL